MTDRNTHVIVSGPYAAAFIRNGKSVMVIDTVAEKTILVCGVKAALKLATLLDEVRAKLEEPR